MSLSSRFGLSREASALPDDSAIFLTKAAAGHEANAGLKSPQVRTIRGAGGNAAPLADDNTPYPSRSDAEPLSLIDRARITIDEWELGDRFFTPMRAAASRLKPRFKVKFKPNIRLKPSLKLSFRRKPKPVYEWRIEEAEAPAEPAPATHAIPVVQPESKPKSAPVSVAKPLPIPVAKPAPTQVAKPAPVAAVKPAPKAETKAAAMPAPKPVVRTAPKPAPKPVSQLSPKPAAVTTGKKNLDRGDLTLGALGVVLAVTCALFPWYIFFNQDKFGVREFVFEGNGQMTPPAQIAYQPSLVGQHFQTGEVPKMELDFFPTATVSANDEARRAVPVSEQPFPSDLVTFRLIHVANGRAMIQDEDGLWIVQPGSRLPDSSQVAAIEQRKGQWVLVTTHDKVVSLTP